MKWEALSDKQPAVCLHRTGPRGPKEGPLKSEQLTNEKLDALAGEFRYVITDMICRAGFGHLGGALSLVEIVITLY